MVHALYRLRELAAIVSVLLLGCAAQVDDHTLTYQSTQPTTTPAADSRAPQPKTAPPGISREWAMVADRLRPAIVVLGTDAVIATGFVISKKHRLVVTAGHVADLIHGSRPVMAVCNNGKAFYSLSRAWYHPRVERMGSNSIPVPSESPADGSIAATRFDVAVVQLSSDGPELTAELDIARDEEQLNLVGRAVGCLCFVPEDSMHFQGEETRALPIQFTVSKLISRTVAVDDPAIALNSQVCIASLPGAGTSGSPVFLPNGRVIGVVTSAMESRTTQVHVASKVATLRELIAYHHLTSLVPSINAASGQPLTR